MLPVLSRNARGVAVQQPDGSVVFMPPELAPAADASLPPPLDAESARPNLAPTAEDLATSPVPDIARDAVAADLRSGAIAPPKAPGVPTDTPGAINMAGENITAGQAGARNVDQPINPDEIELDGAAPAPTLDENGINPDDIEIEPNDDRAALVAQGLVEPSAPVNYGPGAADIGLAGPTGSQADYLERQARIAEAGGVIAFDAARQQQAIADEAAKAAAEQRALAIEAQAKNLARQRELTDAYGQAVDELAAFNINAPKPGTGAQVRRMIALALGAVGNALSRSNGPNPVLAILQQKAQAEAEARTRRYVQLKDTVGARENDLDRLGKMSSSTAAYYQAQIAASNEEFAREAERAAKIAGGQEALLNGAKLAAELRQKKAEALEKAGQQAFSNEKDAADLMLRDRAQREAAENARYTAKTGRLSVYQQGAKMKMDAEQFDRSFGETVRKNTADIEDKIARLQLERDQLAKGSPQQQRVDMDKQIRDAQTSLGLMPVAVRDDQGRVVDAKLDELRNAPTPVGPNGPTLGLDGKPAGILSTGPDGQQYEALPFRTLSEKEGDEMRKKQKSTVMMVDLIDRMTREIAANGWESDTLRSPAWQKMQADYGNLVIDAKDAFGLGVINGPDLQIVGSAVGTSDPTQVRDPSAGLTRARQVLLERFNADLRAQRYSGEPFDIPDVSSPTALKKAANQSPAGKAAEETAAAARSGRSMAGWVGSLAGITDEDLVKGQLGPRAAEKIAPLLTLAKKGDTAALAGLANLTYDKKIGAGVKRAIARHGIDLGEYLTPELKTELGKINEQLAKRTPEQIRKEAELESWNTPGTEIPGLEIAPGIPARTDGKTNAVYSLADVLSQVPAVPGDDKVDPLIRLAESGNEVALAGLAEMARDERIGKRVRALVAKRGINLGVFSTPELDAELAKIRSGPLDAELTGLQRDLSQGVTSRPWTPPSAAGGAANAR